MGGFNLNAPGLISAGTIGLPGLSDAEVAASLGMEYTGERDQDQMVQDAVEQARAQSARVEGTAPSAEEIAQRTKQYEEVMAWLQADPRNAEQWFGKRDYRRPGLRSLATGLLSLAVPGVASGIVGTLFPAAGATSAGAAAALGGSSGGLGALGTTALTSGVGAGLGAGLAAATGGDPLQGALGGALGGAGAGAGRQGVTALGSLSSAGPSVIEQVFSDSDYREGGVIPEQPFETQAPIIEPTQAEEQAGGGGGGAPAPSPDTTRPETEQQQVDPEQPFIYEGNGRFVNVITGEVIIRDVPDTFVVGDFYGLPQNVEEFEPEQEEEEVIIDVLGEPDIEDTTAPELPESESDTPAPEPATGQDESVDVGGEGTGTGTGVGEGEGPGEGTGTGGGEGEGEGEGEGDGEGPGAGGMLAAAMAGAAFKPKWTELFKYTTLTPYQKKTLEPYVDYIAQARRMQGRGMLS